MTPPVVGQRELAEDRTGVPGRASCQRISIAIVPPHARKKSPYQRNCFPTTLWSRKRAALGHPRPPPLRLAVRRVEAPRGIASASDVHARHSSSGRTISVPFIR